MTASSPPPLLAARQARHAPVGDRRCGWIELAPGRPEVRALAGEVRADACVVGAGFTGLAIARRLAELRPAWRVAVLDAQRAGGGASGRSSGFVVDLAHFIARMDFAASRRFVALSRFGIGRLRAAVAAGGIACDWDEKGWVHAAAGDAGAAALPGLAAWLDRLGEPYERLDAEGLAAITGSRFYRAGIRLPGSVLVQAGALAAGLAAALPAGVDLSEESPVQRIEPERSGFRIATAAGAVRADRLFLAANGYTPEIGFLRRRLFPLYTFGSLTRPLTEVEQEALGGEREWGLLAEDAMGSTVRRTRDQRILIRNSARFTRHHERAGTVPPAVLARHRRAFERRFPALRGVPFEFSWSGPMGTTPDRTIAFGEIARGLFAAAGYTGAGIAMGTTAGTLLADLALGEGSDLLAALLALPRPRRLPPPPFLDWGIRLEVARMNATAGGAL